MKSAILMKKKLYLHIGQYKTGSTSLQEFLAANRDVLLKSGYLYPKSFVRDSAHYILDDLLRLEYLSKSSKADLSELLSELSSSNHDALIISCEALSGNVLDFNVEQTIYIWNRIVGIFSDYEVIPIVYIRRQDDAIESRIIESIKGRVHNTLIDVDVFLKNDSVLNYNYFLSQLSEVFGKTSIRLRIYNRNILIGADIAKDFIDLCGIGSPSLRYSDHAHNTSPGGKYLEFVRNLNKFRLSYDKEVKIKKLAWSLFKAGGDVERVKVLDLSVRKKIMNYYFDSNIELIKNYGLHDMVGYMKEFFGECEQSESNCKLDLEDVFNVFLGYISTIQGGDSQ